MAAYTEVAPKEEIKLAILKTSNIIFAKESLA